MSDKLAFNGRKMKSSFAPRAIPVGSPIGSGAASQDDIKRSHQFTNISSELTRNSKYSVSKLNATPNVLNTTNAEQLAGQIDENTGNGLLISEESIFTWDYNSVDEIPTTIQLPVIPQANGFLPLALLVSPSAGETQPGIISINTRTGHVRFYESIGNVSSVGLLQHHKGIDHLIKLFDKEYITLAKNIEPAGIFLTTSQGRIILLSLRDPGGKPFIKSSEIQKRQTGFFSSTLHESRRIVSIQRGSIIGYGERVVVFITAGADFQIWSCSRDGQSKQIYQHDLLNILVTSLQELYPNAANTLEVLDLCLLPNFEGEDVFLLLTSFQNTPGESCYVLFTVKKEANHLLVFSAYKLNTFSSPYTVKPELYVPAPGSTAFIVFDNSIVLTELVTTLDHTLNLKKKWEDIVTFRSDISIIGSGSENLQVKNGVVLRAPAVYAIIPRSGILKIERQEDSKEEAEVKEVSSFIKSHIEQAVFYGDESQNPIEFDLPSNLSLQQAEIEADLIQVAEEIFLSTSIYLPPRLSSLEAHLELRKSRLERLINYTAANFSSSINFDIKLILTSIFEKLSAALNLQKILNKYSNVEELSDVYQKSLKQLRPNADPSFITNFFISGLNDLNSFLGIFLKNLNDARNLEDIAVGVVSEIFSVVLEIEKSIRYGLFDLDSTQVAADPLWFAENDSYVLVDEIFQKLANTQRHAVNDKTRQYIIELAELLFYLVQQNTIWLSYQSPKTREIQESLTKVEGFYKAKSGVWTKTLVLFGAKAEALAIAETYRDLKSLAEISEDDRENSYGEDLERVNLRFEHYFRKFGYEFAETLYEYYVFTGKYQVLLLGFQDYSDYLKTFFSKNDHGKIAWIKDVFDGNYSNASKTLLNVSQRTEESQTNRLLQLSIAKLSALAADPTEEDKELLQEIQEELDYSEAQTSILQQLSSYIRSDSDPSAQADAIVKDLLNANYNSHSSKFLKESFQRAISRLLSNRKLSVNELVDIFTLLDSLKTDTKQNFFYALKVLHLSNLSSSDKTVNEKLIWKRAILADDWRRIISLENKSSEYVKERIEGTVIFETLVRYFQDELYLSNNDYQIGLPDVKQLAELDSDFELQKHFKFVGASEFEKLKEELKAENDALVELYSFGDFGEWIKGLIGTANEASGTNKVINYTNLSIE